MQRERPISALSVLEELAQADSAPEDQKESESRDVLILHTLAIYQHFRHILPCSSHDCFVLCLYSCKYG